MKMQRVSLCVWFSGWLALTCLLAGCAAEAPEEQGAEVAAEPTLSLLVFDCGHFQIDDPQAFSLAIEEVAIPQLFVPCYLIRHEAGTLLWDAGLPPAMAEEPGGVELSPGVLVTYETPLSLQLEVMGISPADVTHVAFSHMHFDHVGSANLFSGSTLLIQRAEHEAAFAEDAPVELFDRQLYGDLADSETVFLDGDHDVFGDGRVLILSAPGHTPGHQVLFLDLEETGPIVLSGDLYHFPESRELRRVPQFNSDAEQTLESMDRIEDFLEERRAELWIEHDFAFSQTLRLAPEAYD